MHILFLTHYFPPEVNAPASRTYENARRWVQAGHKATIITCVPSHPGGVVYPGYKNRPFQWDDKDGIRILRVMTYLSPNQGFLKRTCSYISYMLSATLFSPLVKDVDVVISTSPQFFCGMAGLWVSLLKRRSWILEIRDLWPESIIAVGAIKQRAIIRLLEGLENLLYFKADQIVSVTRSFKEHIVSRGAPSSKVTVLTNGADFEQFNPLPKHNGIRQMLGLEDKFVASYIGTHGMAHGLDMVLKAADILRDRKGFAFLLIGDGAERENLLKEKEKLRLDNVVMLPQQPKEKMPEFLAASDACMVLLKKKDLFKTVIPSKIFEAMAMERPIILGVQGESREIVEEGKCGLCIEPENHEQLAGAVVQLCDDPNLMEMLGRNGRSFVELNYDRDGLARRYLELIRWSAMFTRQGTSIPGHRDAGTVARN